MTQQAVFKSPLGISDEQSECRKINYSTVLLHIVAQLRQIIKYFSLLRAGGGGSLAWQWAKVKIPGSSILSLFREWPRAEAWQSNLNILYFQRSRFGFSDSNYTWMGEGEELVRILEYSYPDLTSS